MNGLTIHDITPGQSASFTKTVSEYDVYAFAGITGDFNPVHINAPYAEGTMFEGRIAHGILCAGFISTVLGTHVPGPGAIYISQSLAFKKPVRIGDTITAVVEVAEIIVERNRVRFNTRCVNQHNDIVAEGESLLMPRRA
ncbi:MAG TPA: MaoC family dehydratase [Bacteroidota bacterium]|nr:MaoC family dehydratase [Bacteroidota bacterium]